MATSVPTPTASVKPARSAKSAAQPGRSRCERLTRPNLVEAARHAIVERSSFNRQMLAMRAMLRKLRRRLDDFSAHDADHELMMAWEAAGLPEAEEGDPVAGGHVLTAEVMPREAYGFLWAVESFLASLDANVVESSERRQKVRRRAEQRATRARGTAR